MLVFLVRHAHAEPGEPDELRALSQRGHSEARAVGARLAGHPRRPATVLSSPLFRARETARAIAEATGARVEIDERLAPGMTADELREAIGADRGAAVAVVGHQPDCSQVALELTGRDPGFPPGGFVELELTD